MEAKQMKRISVVALILVSFMAFCNAPPAAEPIHPIFRESATRVDFPFPNEQRDERYARFLSASVKISVNGSAGSGTICYYDSSSGWAYVASCGHLWSGSRSYGDGLQEKARVIVWRHNEARLEEPREYDAEVLFWSNERGYDSSLLRFKCDWKPEYFPISYNFNLKKGDILNSMGCDGGREVARYEVRFVEKRNIDIITELNSPRPGRSGGGLITNGGELVGICWGTSDTSGKGIGYFTPFSSIKAVFSKNNHGWLLKVKRNAETVPIIDWDRPGTKYEGAFIPLPLMF
jgi:hypothetical protein